MGSDNPIRVLIVDDAVVVRKIISDALSEAEDISIVGTAANGKLALQKIPLCTPDIITLDIEMPEMDGLETLQAIKKSFPKIPVIMFSTLSERGARITLQALSLGAADYCTKPANVGRVTASMETVRDSMLAKIRALVPRVPATPPVDKPISVTPARVEQAPLPRRTIQRVAPFAAVAIGVSTGGPNALADLVDGFPKNFHLPILVVQHMPPLFTRLLAERLDSKSNLTVVEAEEGMRVQPGWMYLAPGDYHMVVRSDATGMRIGLNQNAPENSCRPAVDVLFRSVAEVYGSKVLSLVLTGMGYDGLKGGEVIKAAGGYMIAQDKATSVVWGMPGAVTEKGVADEALPLSQITERVLQLTSSNSAVSSSKLHSVGAT